MEPKAQHRVVPPLVFTAIVSLIGCQSYDRELYRVLTTDASTEVIARDGAAMDTSVDATDGGVDLDAMDIDSRDASDVADDDGTDANPPLDAIDVSVGDVTDTGLRTDVGVDAIDATATDATRDAVVSCDAALGPNDLLNPGFELGLTDWNNYVDPFSMATFDVVTTNPHSGTHCLEVDVTGSGPADYYVELLHGNLAVHAGVRTHVESWVRAANPSTISFALSMTASPYTRYCYQSFLVGTSWSLVSFDCTPPVADPDTTLSIGLGLASGIVAFDDARVAEFADCP